MESSEVDVDDVETYPMARGIMRSCSASASGYVSSPPRMTNYSGSPASPRTVHSAPGSPQRVVFDRDTSPDPVPRHGDSLLRHAAVQERAMQSLIRKAKCHEKKRTRLFLEENVAACGWSERAELIERARAKRTLHKQQEAATKDARAVEHRRAVQERAKQQQVAQEVWMAEQHRRLETKLTEVEAMNANKQKRAARHNQRMVISRSTVERDGEMQERQLRSHAFNSFNEKERRMEATQRAVAKLKHDQQEMHRRDRVQNAEQQRMFEKAKVEFEKRIAAETFKQEMDAKKRAERKAQQWAHQQPHERRVHSARQGPTVPAIDRDRYNGLLTNRYSEASEIAARLLELDKSVQLGERKFTKMPKSWRPVAN